MTRTSILFLGLAAAIAFPTAAAAQCGSTQGSFSVTCERGVQVYRHNALSGIPAPLSHAEANLQAAQLRAKTERLRIASQDRANQLGADLRERELAIEDYRARVYNRNTRRNAYAVGTYGNRGYNFARPVRIRKGSLNVKH